MRERLDQYVISQDRAKMVLSVAVYNHYKRLRAGYHVDDVELGKSNVLLLGPTGSGKTLLAQTLARMLEVPFAIADATALTEAGYVGEDVENILLRLIQAADGDIERAQTGIIYVDEIDKIARKSDNPSITRDVSGEGVQQALLKILEGCIAHVPPLPGRKHPQQEYIAFDTTHVLFICGGAFEGLNQIIAQRVGGQHALGFGSNQNHRSAQASAKKLAQCVPDDLLRYGFIPEFVGRMPVITALEPFDKESMIRILTEPRNAVIKQYQKMFALDHAGAGDHPRRDRGDRRAGAALAHRRPRAAHDGRGSPSGRDVRYPLAGTYRALHYQRRGCRGAWPPDYGAAHDRPW